MPVVKVKGMSCQHCAKSVTQALEALGAANVRVDLLSGNVTYDEPNGNGPIDKSSIAEAIVRIGFEVVG
ncbi:mercury transporter [Pseudodesulfovibrio sp. F-1]|uniref:Mercury transporter n=1 Tax=Pseudodesulfovibrio alkaliphilus TaxID=2661613 RepID=A0A7K1KMZ1_9BACT|nr:cation transporter [Pseudodesulfovibrio alkaliphilus]MUM77397.1 mercury transporter [Pseudodesulfovibrio alkaliphilus]